ncbi:MAG: hypothetical protein NZL93_07030, partial [Chthoniobacterales bacterium]|nr:hypothetical protein [Chthoniobacterales bacterium]
MEDFSVRKKLMGGKGSNCGEGKKIENKNEKISDEAKAKVIEVMEKRFEELLEKLSNVKQGSSSSQFQASCPAHDDKNPSLSLKLDESGKILLHCFSGCEPEAVCKALDVELSYLCPPSEPAEGPGNKNHSKKEHSEKEPSEKEPSEKEPLKLGHEEVASFIVEEGGRIFKYWKENWYEFVDGYYNEIKDDDMAVFARRMAKELRERKLGGKA